MAKYIFNIHTYKAVDIDVSYLVNTLTEATPHCH